PFGEGWIIRITVQDAAELEQLMSAAAYKKFTGK
ncbi:MAG: glycine cleavage system protein H, partial [Proteiniphilum sp.]|nr:glycine cleavage system protein H [Proteiniphilum sp.]